LDDYTVTMCKFINLSHIQINDLLKVSVTIIIISSKSITLVHSSMSDLWYTYTHMNNVRGNTTRIFKGNPNSVQKTNNLCQ
jgi:hypothetical protein